MLEEAIRLQAVSHSYGDLEALRGASLTAGVGDIYGFLGLNGAGKTTAIRILVGLLRLQRGEVFVLGTPIRNRPRPLFRKVTVLFEDFAAPPYLTGEEHAYLQGRLLGLSRRQAREEARTWLARLGLQRKEAVKIRKYSMGMRRRLGLACAFLGTPQVVILDEPTNGLDPEGIAQLRNLITSLNRTEGVTFLLSSHILGEVEQLCGKVGIVHQGRMLLEGAVSDLVQNERNVRRIRVAPRARALQKIHELTWCSEDEEVTTVKELPASPAHIRVRVASEEVPRLVRELVLAGIEVHEVSPPAENLETVFHRTLAREGARKSTGAGNDPAAAPAVLDIDHQAP